MNFNVSMTGSGASLGHGASTSSIFFDHLFQETDCRQISPSKQQLLRHYFDCLQSNARNGLECIEYFAVNYAAIFLLEFNI